jgi:DNA gyrase inhibitor GyrI
MTVDFVVWNAPSYRVATKTMVGEWPGDRKIRAEFENLASWAKKQGLRTGRWIFRELNGPEVPSKKRKWEVGIEIRAREPIRGGDGVSIKLLPRTRVVSVTFDPGKVSPELIYHGLESWLSWRKKSKELKQNGLFREVYRGNPWKSKGAWTHTQVQVPVKRL